MNLILLKLLNLNKYIPCPPDVTKLHLNIYNIVLLHQRAPKNVIQHSTTRGHKIAILPSSTRGFES